MGELSGCKCPPIIWKHRRRGCKVDHEAAAPLGAFPRLFFFARDALHLYNDWMPVQFSKLCLARPFASAHKAGARAPVDPAAAPIRGAANQTDVGEMHA
jgi:hypothetical protein